MSNKTPEKQSDAEQLLIFKNVSEGYQSILTALVEGTFQVKHMQNAINAITFIKNLKKDTDAKINTLEKSFFKQENSQTP